MNLLASRPPSRLPSYAAIAWLCAVLASTPAAMAETTFTERSGAPDQTQMLSRSGAGLDGMAFVRPVLSGVLYRGGFKGGDKHHSGLSQAQRQQLCELGFSSAWYIDFGSKTAFGEAQCGSSTLDYHKGNSNHTHAIMEDIYRVITDPTQGPVMVHCMWGVHSSGAVAAMALVQFCDWSESKAKAYWNNARNKAPCGHAGCDAWIDAKFRRFKPDPVLTISNEQRQAICP